MAANWNSFPQTSASLRIDLQRLKYHSEAAEKDLAVDALKSVLLNRIAALESAGAIHEGLTSEPAQIATLLSLARLEALQEVAESIPRQKLD